MAPPADRTLTPPAAIDHTWTLFFFVVLMSNSRSMQAHVIDSWLRCTHDSDALMPQMHAWLKCTMTQMPLATLHLLNST